MAGMEKGDGGSSRQRRRNQRIEKEVQKVLSRQQQKQQDLPAPALKHPGKLILLWRSTPVWRALGVLAGALLSQVSVNILFIFVWIVVCAEFVSLRISEKKPIRYLVNIAFTVLLAAMFIIVWHVTPRAKVP